MPHTPSLFDLPETPIPERRDVYPHQRLIRTPYAKGSETSKAAAERAKNYVGEQGRKVLRWFIDQGWKGGTQREASLALKIDRASICARVNALEHRGDLKKSSVIRERCAVYTAKDRP